MSFRQKHPVIFGLFILAGIVLFFGGALSLLVSTILSPNSQADIFAKTGVGIVEIKGLIVEPEKTISTLTSFRKSKNVKAIVLRIDSPGGAVGASQEIFEEVKRTNKVKPVIASLGSVGASGGYYAALGAEQILANPGTLTGSVGVIVKFANLEELFAKIGFKNEVVKSGSLKDIGATYRPMTEEERGLLQGVIDNIHEQFILAVAEQRSIQESKVRELADGRLFTGEQALDEGLIDKFGNLTDAVLLAAKLGNLDTEDPELIYPEREKFSLLGLITGASSLVLQNGLLRNFPYLSYEWNGTR